MSMYQNIAELFWARAEQDPTQLALETLEHPQSQSQRFTREELVQRVAPLAAGLASRGLGGQRVLIALASSGDAVQLLHACLAAGVTAVPYYPPPQDWAGDATSVENLIRVALHSGASAVVTDEPAVPGLARLLSVLGVAVLRTADLLQESAGTDFSPRASEGPAYIAYTSGSTGTPRGVPVTHGVLLTALAATQRATGTPDGSACVSWLPFPHDMGLVAHVFLSVYVGGHVSLLPTKLVVADPALWLVTIARQTRPVLSAAPPSALRQCVLQGAELKRRLQEQALDLGGWRVAMLSGERVAPEVLQDFTEMFRDAQFSQDALTTVYGLTEAHLVSCERPADPGRQYDADTLAPGKRAQVATSGGEPMVRLTSCGSPLSDTRLYIVDVEGDVEMPQGYVGEVCVQGPTVIDSYWREPAPLWSPTHHGNGAAALRTGDLGFLDEAGSLVVCGRAKDMGIVRGRNLYFMDVEEVARRVLHPFGVEAVIAATDPLASEERLYVAYELPQSSAGSAEDAARRVAQVVTEGFGATPDIVTCLPGQLPRTTTGKLLRRELVRQLRDGQLSHEDTARATQVERGAFRLLDVSLSESERDSVYYAYIRHCLDALVKNLPPILPPDQSLAGLGLDSLRRLQLLSQLEWAAGSTLRVKDMTVGALTRAVAAAVSGSQVLELPVVVGDARARFEPFALTELQQAYLFGRSDQFELGGVAAHAYIEIESGLDVGRLQWSWQRLIERHDMLRAVMVGNRQQRVLPEVPQYEFETIDVRTLPAPEQARVLDEVRARLSHEVRDAERWPLFDIRVTVLDEDVVRLHLSLDLLLFDVWSVRILLREWEEIYRNPDRERLALDLTFRDYVTALESLPQSGLYSQARDYWTARLAALPEAPQLPLVKAPAEVAAPRFVRRSARLSSRQWREVKRRAAAAGLTPSSVVLGAYSRVLGAWSGQQQFLVNVTLFNRLPLHEAVNDIVGDFTSVNLLAVDLAEVSGHAAVSEKIQQRLWDDLEHRYYGGIEVLRDLGRLRGVGAALAPVVFTSALGQGGEDDDLPMHWLGQEVTSVSQTPQVWLDHQVMEQDGDLLLNWDAVEELFPPAVLDDMFEVYQSYLRALADDDALWTHDTFSWPTQTQLASRRAANETAVDIPPSTLDGLFYEAAGKHPERVAVRDDLEAVTYAELAGRVEAVAADLLGRQVAGRLVGIAIPKSVDQIVAVLAVLTAGAAYLPIDPTLPALRQDVLAESGELDLVLISRRWEGRTDWVPGVACLVVDEYQQPGEPLPPAKHTPEALAYVLFTSGSTGTPKGVMISHDAAVNTIVSINRLLDISADDCVLGISALSFDLSVYDLFGLLSRGGQLVLPGPDDLREPRRWLELVRKHRVTVWNSVPALMAMLAEQAISDEVDDLPFRAVMLSGDWIPVHLPALVKQVAPQTAIYSLGGATEAAIWSIYHPVSHVSPDWDSIPYGTPLPNQELHVLDADLKHAPDWVTGHLYIGGVGLAQGYWKDPDKTAASFIRHPSTGKRLYRTGDLGRYRPGGVIEFLGRADTQVKINGYRIELGEIEAALASAPGVRQAVATTLGERPHQTLGAFILPHETTGSGLQQANSAPAEAGGGAPGATVVDPLARLEVKLQRPALRRDLGDVAVMLDRAMPTTARHSSRNFTSAAVDIRDLGRLLSTLHRQEDGVLGKYQYGSAGHTYGVQAYVHARNSGVDGLPPGLYYYHPDLHALCPTAAAVAPELIWRPACQGAALISSSAVLLAPLFRL